MKTQAPRSDPTRARSGAKLAALGCVAVLLFSGLVALGTWQVHRLIWKRALIAAVDARIHAPPAPFPPPSAWPTLTAGADAYRRVTARGTFLNGEETLVQAVTELGPGFWVLTPFRTDQGMLVLVNRGFVPPDRRAPTTRSDGEISGETRVTGLLRVSEPHGAFLRANDPAANRWYSRDTAAIAKARHLGSVAPYFVDADAALHPGAYPVGGLTVVAFPNNHLVYAITWYALAAMLAGWAGWIFWEERCRAREERRGEIARATPS